MLASNLGEFEVLDGETDLMQWITYHGDISPAFGQNFLFLQRDIEKTDGVTDEDGYLVHCKLQPFSVIAKYPIPNVELLTWGNSTEDTIDFVVRTGYGYLVCTYNAVTLEFKAQRYETDIESCFSNVRLQGDTLFACLTEREDESYFVQIENGKIVAKIPEVNLSFELSANGKYMLAIDNTCNLTSYIKGSDGKFEKHTLPFPENLH